MLQTRFGGFIALVLLLTVLAGCSGGSTDAGKASNEITLSENWAFGSFGPLTTEAGDYGIMYYARNFYETLVNYDNGKILPGLAESWEISDDGRVYTFHLRKNAAFTDGAAFDAEAVKKNLTYIPLNLGAYNGFYGLVTTLFEQVVVVDPHTVEVHLSHPYYGALNDFSMELPLAMVSPNVYNEDGSYKDLLQTATYGTGPYKYEGETDGTTYTFVRNPDYWGKQSRIERFHVKTIADNDARQLAFRNGELDLLIGSRQMSSAGFVELKAAGYGALVSEGASNTQYLLFNPEKAPFDDLKVRQAANYAIDKAGIVASVLDGIGAAADSWFDPHLPYADVRIKAYTYDKSKAIALLEEAGWFDRDGDGVREKDGVPLEGELLYSTYVPVLEDLALVLVAQLKEIGMNLKLTHMEVAASYGEQDKGNYGLTHTWTYGGVWDPHTTMTNAKPGPDQNGALNRAFRLVDNAGERIDALNFASDTGKIRETYDFLLREVNDKALMIPLYYSKEMAVYNGNKIKAFTFEGALGPIYVPSVELK